MFAIVFIVEFLLFLLLKLFALYKFAVAVFNLFIKPNILRFHRVMIFSTSFSTHKRRACWSPREMLPKYKGTTKSIAIESRAGMFHDNSVCFHFLRRDVLLNACRWKIGSNNMTLFITPRVTHLVKYKNFVWEFVYDEEKTRLIPPQVHCWKVQSFTSWTENEINSPTYKREKNSSEF